MYTPSIFLTRILRTAAIVTVSCALALCCRAQSRQPIQVSVDSATGVYTVRSMSPAMTFSGTTGSALHQVTRSRGTDAVGAFRQLSFLWNDTLSYAGSIRWYDSRPVVLFSLTLPEGSRGHSPEKFPRFTRIPELPYHFSYHNHIFALPEFYLEETSTPWMLFDKQRDACVISPASDFIVSLMTHEDSTVVASGLNPEVKDLQAGFTHCTIMVTGRGIGSTWDEWGKAMRQMYHRRRPANDHGPILKYYGYWTDNGADYYYHYDTTRGYAGTLLEVARYYKAHDIPLGYMQLDSWWYEKTRYNVYGRLGKDKKIEDLPAGLWNRSGGLLRYQADPSLFPKGLKAFRQALGVPLVTHNRWMDSTSPYHQKYRISGLSAVDPAFWHEIMAYLKNSGVAVYEQDWMNYMYRLNPEMISDLRVGSAFTDGMAYAAMDNGIDLQYCMALPRYYMQGLRYDNLTTIRPSGDRFKPERWKDFIYTSRFAYEMGIWPWCDVFKSRETGNMTVAVLSAGAVGTGDSIGTESRANILKAARTDGVLVKPDAPLVPMDGDYIRMAQHVHSPHLAYTYTRHHDLVTGYVFVYRDTTTATGLFSFRPSETGVKGTAVVYDPGRGALSVVKPGGSFRGDLSEDPYRYYVVAPLTPTGIAFLGDENKIARTGKKRVRRLSVEGDQLYVELLFAPGEKSVTLQGYCTSDVTSDVGRIRRGSATSLFTLEVPAPAHGNTVSVHLRATGSR